MHNKVHENRQWDNLTPDFDVENHVCIGRTVENTREAQATIFCTRDEGSISVTMINDEVPLALKYFALEALSGNPVFCRISSTGDWFADAKGPSDKAESEGQ